MPKKQSYIIILSIILLNIAFHLPHLQKDLISIHVWRQTQTQCNIENFYKSKKSIFFPERNEIVNGKNLNRMEFPLMQWLVAKIYIFTGNKLIISRLFVLIISILTAFGFFLFTHILTESKFQSIVAFWSLTFSPTFFYYSINPMPDIFALCMAIYSLVFWFLYLKKRRIYLFTFALIFFGLATLCKLPYIILFCFPIFFDKNKYVKQKLLKFLLITYFLSFPFFWYLKAIPLWNDNIIIKGIFSKDFDIIEFIDNISFNIYSTLPDLLLNYSNTVFLIFSIYILYKKRVQIDNIKSIFYVFGAFLLLFVYEINAIGKTHDYYFLPIFPFLFLIVSFGASELYLSEHKFTKNLAILILIMSPIFCLLRMKDRWNEREPGFNKDFLIYKNQLRKLLPHTKVIVGNDESHNILLYYLDRKGWVFDSNNLDPQKMDKWIFEGAEYLVTDSKEIIENQKIIPYFKKIKYRLNTLYIIELKNKNKKTIHIK